jgi:hypothetical protein
MEMSEAEAPKWLWRGAAVGLAGLAVFFVQDKLVGIESGIREVATEQRSMSSEQQQQKTSVELIKNDLGRLKTDVDTLRKNDTDNQQRLYDLQMRIPQRATQ